MTTGKKPDDDPARLVDAAYDDASTAAGHAAGIPRPAAHRLAAIGLALTDELEGVAGSGVVMATEEGALAPDTGRILAMDRGELVGLVTHLHAGRGDAVDAAQLERASVDELRAAARSLRPRRTS